MIEFKMPSLGADMEAGTLVAWHKQPGDQIQRGELIADVETDKGVIAVEAFDTGILERIVANVGTCVPVGTVLALIQDGKQPLPTHEPEMVVVPVAPMTCPPASKSGTSAEPTDVIGASVQIPAEAHVHDDTDRVPMSPSARRLARELGVDPHTVHGTGHGGAVTREDVERAAKSQTTPSPAVQVTQDRNARMRQSIAAAMSRSKREIPHYYLSTTIDMHATLNWIADYNSARGVEDRILYGVLLIKAVARSLHVVPELNAIWDNGQVILKPQIHIGTAISLRKGGLLAPAIHDADQKSLPELMIAFRDLVNRTRAGGLRASELSDPTITVTSLGENGVDSVFGVIYPPQVAIVGFGKIVERPWSINGGIFSRPVMTATLSGDHRVSDGHRGAVFLATVEKLLQEPDQL